MLNQHDVHKNKERLRDVMGIIRRRLPEIDLTAEGAEGGEEEIEPRMDTNEH